MADHQHIAAMLAILRGDRDGYGRARVWRRRRAARHPRRLRRGDVRTRRPGPLGQRPDDLRQWRPCL